MSLPLHEGCGPPPKVAGQDALALVIALAVGVALGVLATMVSDGAGATSTTGFCAGLHATSNTNVHRIPIGG